MPSQQWDELTKEIMGDLTKMLLATPTIKVVIGIVQWNGKLYARPVYQPTTIQIGDEGETQGISVMFEPPDEWDVVDLPIKPVHEGNPVTDNMPIFYYLIIPGGSGLAIPSRFGQGKISWSHSTEWIDAVDAALRIGMEGRWGELVACTN